MSGVLGSRPSPEPRLGGSESSRVRSSSPMHPSNGTPTSRQSANPEFLWRAKPFEARRAKKGGDRTATRSVTRCGCCLPALTRLARRSSAADLRGGIWRIGTAGASRAGTAALDQAALRPRVQVRRRRPIFEPRTNANGRERALPAARPSAWNSSLSAGRRQGPAVLNGAFASVRVGSRLNQDGADAPPRLRGRRDGSQPAASIRARSRLDHRPARKKQGIASAEAPRNTSTEAV